MKKVMVDAPIYEEMIKHCRSEYPKEACGLLAGTEERDHFLILKLFKMRNVFKAPKVGYFMDPKEQFEVFRRIRNLGLEFLGIYHSHPLTPARPSEKDIEMAYYPEAVYVIVSLVDFHNPVVKGFRIVDGEVNEVDLIVRKEVEKR